MKKRVLISLASAALLSVGAVGIGHVQGVNAPQTVQAASKAKTTFKVKLTKNAVVYSSRGKRKTKKTLKKGHVYLTYGKKTIRGKKYYLLSKGQYIKSANATKINGNNGIDKNISSDINKNMPFSYKVIHNASIYNGLGEQINTLKKGSWVTGTAHMSMKGQDYLQIGHDQYVKVINLLDNRGNKINTPSNVTNNGNIDNHDSNNSDQQSNTKNEEIKEEYAGYTPDGYDYVNGSYHYYQDDQDYYQESKAYAKKHNIVFFTPTQAREIQNCLWNDIQTYRQSCGLPEFKHNQELQSLMNKINPNTIDKNQDVLSTSSVDNLKKALPNLTSLGMIAGTTRLCDDTFGYDSGFMFTEKDLSSKDPKDVADAMFRVYKEKFPRLFRGYNDKFAYFEVGILYDPKARAITTSFGEVAGISPTWIEAWNRAN